MERNIINETKQRKVHCIGNIVFRSGLLRQSIEENKKKDTRDGKTWKKSEQLLYGHQERRRYWKLKEDVIDRSPWKTRYEKCDGRVARHNNYKDYFLLQHYVF